MANCFCKVRNHAQCFTLNTSIKYHCCFRIKDLNAISNPKFFRDMTIFRDFQGPRPRRDIGRARRRRDRDTQKRVSRRVSRHPVLDGRAQNGKIVPKSTGFAPRPPFPRIYVFRNRTHSRPVLKDVNSIACLLK